MAADGVTADPAALDQAGQQFDAVAQQLGQVNETLSGTLAGLGNFWGNDEFGQEFSGKYVGPAQTWLDQNAADTEQAAALAFQSQLDG